MVRLWRAPVADRRNDRAAAHRCPRRIGELLGGVISYATRLKATLAGVDAATLAELGPVAERTAAEMARGVAERCNADWGVATTGSLGPESQDGHPVGEVFVAVSNRAGDLLRVKELSLEGERDAIRQQAAVAALALLADALGLHSISAVADDDASGSERGPLWCCQ